MKIINTNLLDRDIAILIFNRKVYEENNHEEALQIALKEVGINKNIIDCANEVEIHRLESEMATLHIFTDYDKQNYIIADSKEIITNPKNKELINNIIDKYKYPIGYYTNFTSGIAIEI